MNRCNYCAFEARRADSLRRHEISKHNDKQNYILQCKECKYNTTRRDSLNRHIRLKHQRLNASTCDTKETSVANFSPPIKYQSPWLSEGQTFIENTEASNESFQNTDISSEISRSDTVSTKRNFAIQ